MIEMVIYFCAVSTAPLEQCKRIAVPDAVYATYDECEHYALQLNEGAQEAGGMPLKQQSGQLIACEPSATQARKAN